MVEKTFFCVNCHHELCLGCAKEIIKMPIGRLEAKYSGSEFAGLSADIEWRCCACNVKSPKKHWIERGLSRPRVVRVHPDLFEKGDTKE